MTDAQRGEENVYCILVAGIPAAGKSTMAASLGEKLELPVISKDSVKEILFDHVGFQSRQEKVNLGTAAMEIMYYMAGQLMRENKPFILENNFENASKAELDTLLSRYGYRALTLTLTGDYKVIYQRFLERDASPARHRGHVVNDCYPEKGMKRWERAPENSIRYEDYLYGIEHRGYDTFVANDEQIKVDVTDFSKVDMDFLLERIKWWCAHSGK